MLLDPRHERRLHEEMGLAGCDVQLRRRSRSLRTMLRALWKAPTAGFAAHRRYEHLRSGGMPHETAIRKALGVAPDENGA